MIDKTCSENYLTERISHRDKLCSENNVLREQQDVLISAARALNVFPTVIWFQSHPALLSTLPLSVHHYTAETSHGRDMFRK